MLDWNYGSFIPKQLKRKFDLKMLFKQQKSNAVYTINLYS